MMAMSETQVAQVLQSVREDIEQGVGASAHDVLMPVTNVLEDICRALAISDDEVAMVLGKRETPAVTETVSVPVLGVITGGEEDQEVWAIVKDYFEGGGGG